VSDYLPPVVASLTGNIDDFVAKFEAAKKLLKDFGEVNIPVNLDVSNGILPLMLRELRDISGDAIQQTDLLAQAEQHLAVIQRDTADSSGDLMQQTALLGDRFRGLDDDAHPLIGTLNNITRTAGGTATAAGASIPIWHRWLDLIHFTFAVLGENIVADAIGIAAFGASAAANLGPAVEAVQNLGQTYGYLNKQQMAAADSMTRLKNSFAGAENTGVFAVFYGLLDVIDSKLGVTGGITRQATQAFEMFAAMLEKDFASPQWAVLFGRSSSLVQQDLEALMRMLSAFIQLIPGLLHDFNFLGIGFLNSATLIFRALGYLSEADPTLTRFAYAAYLAWRAYKYLWVGMGTGPGPFQRAATGIGLLATKTTNAAEAFSVLGFSGGVEYLTGISLAALGTVGAIGALGIGVVVLTQNLPGLRNETDSLIQALTQQDHATGDNVAGYQRLANQLQNYAVPATDAMARAAGTATRNIGINTSGSIKLSQAQQQAASTAKALAGNFQYLERTYHLTQAQAYQLANAVGVNLSHALDGTAKTALANYEQAVNAARNPTSVLAYDLGLAANTTMQLDDRVTALGNAFNALLTPFANVIQDTVTWKDGNVTLAGDVSKAHGKVNDMGNAVQRLAANDLAQAIDNTVKLSEDTLQSTGSYAKAEIAIQNEIKVLEALHSKSAEVSQAIHILQEYLDALHSKSFTISAYYQQHGLAPGTPPPFTSPAPSGGGSGGGLPPQIHQSAMDAGAAVIENHIYIDGREVYAATQKQAVRRQKRTGNNGLQRLVR
jgi:hypothetical protein